MSKKSNRFGRHFIYFNFAHLLFISFNSSSFQSNNIQSSQISSFFSKTKRLDSERTSSDDAEASTSKVDKGSLKRKIQKSVEQIEKPASADEEPREDVGVEAMDGDGPTCKLKLYASTARKIAKLDGLDQQNTETENVITKFFSQEKNDSLDDFEEVQKKIPRKKPAAQKVNRTAKKKKISGKKQQPDIRKAIQPQNVFNKLISDHCAIDRIDPEQLQMALALSMSEADDFQLPQLSDDNKGESTLSETVRNTIQQFGFKPNSGKMDTTAC